CVISEDNFNTTYIAVTLGNSTLGEPTKLNHLDKKLLKKIYTKKIEKIAEAIDRMKTSALPVPVIIVGGGSILLPEELPGASEVIRTNNYGVANAIGSAIAQVSGQVERIFSLEELGRSQAVN